ncbi:hypothetical protein KKH43_03415 [Patescibacteria group bacterium]|nr:hypothetical protein [Patescibacteria group bacterium]
MPERGTGDPRKRGNGSTSQDELERAERAVKQRDVVPIPASSLEVGRDPYGEDVQRMFNEIIEEMHREGVDVFLDDLLGVNEKEVEAAEAAEIQADFEESSSELDPFAELDPELLATLGISPVSEEGTEPDREVDAAMEGVRLESEPTELEPPGVEKRVQEAHQGVVLQEQKKLDEEFVHSHFPERFGEVTISDASRDAAQRIALAKKGRIPTRKPSGRRRKPALPLSLQWTDVNESQIFQHFLNAKAEPRKHLTDFAEELSEFLGTDQEFKNDKKRLKHLKRALTALKEKLTTVTSALERSYRFLDSKGISPLFTEEFEETRFADREQQIIDRVIQEQGSDTGLGHVPGAIPAEVKAQEHEKLRREILEKYTTVEERETGVKHIKDSASRIRIEEGQADLESSEEGAAKVRMSILMKGTLKGKGLTRLETFLHYSNELFEAADGKPPMKASVAVVDSYIPPFLRMGGNLNTARKRVRASMNRNQEDYQQVYDLFSEKKQENYQAFELLILLADLSNQSREFEGMTSVEENRAELSKRIRRFSGEADRVSDPAVREVADQILNVCNDARQESMDTSSYETLNNAVSTLQEMYSRGDESFIETELVPALKRSPEYMKARAEFLAAKEVYEAKKAEGTLDDDDMQHYYDTDRAVSVIYFALLENLPTSQAALASLRESGKYKKLESKMNKLTNEGKESEAYQVRQELLEMYENVGVHEKLSRVVDIAQDLSDSLKKELFFESLIKTLEMVANLDTDDTNVSEVLTLCGKKLHEINESELARLDRVEERLEEGEVLPVTPELSVAYLRSAKSANKIGSYIFTQEELKRRYMDMMQSVEDAIEETETVIDRA